MAPQEHPEPAINESADAGVDEPSQARKNEVSRDAARITFARIQEEFPQGRKVRESMWIKARHDTEPLRVKLGEVLKILGVKEVAMAGKLNAFLQDEERGVLLRKTG
jgi:hypothetical protein